MKYYFLNFLDLGNKNTHIKIKSRAEVNIKKSSDDFVTHTKNWTYKNISINGKKILNLNELVNREIVDGEIIAGKTKFQIREKVLINPSSAVEDINKTKGNWENWWKKIRKKSDVDLYDRLWVKSERKLKGEPLFIKKDFKDKIVLDVGCGNGRYIPLCQEFGAKEIIAIDLGKQVFDVKNQDINMNNVHLLQSDLLNIPLRKEIVDTIYSHGVLHHTPNPKESFRYLSNYLKIGGTQAIYVYHKEWWHFSAHKKSYFLDFAYDFGVFVWQSIRKIVSRLPHMLIISFCYVLALKGTFEQSLMKSKFKINRIIGKLFFMIPPICYLGVNFHERIVRNYDHYSATFNYFHTIDEVVEWYKEAGFDNLIIASIPVSIRGKKVRKPSNKINITQHKFISHFEFRKEWEKMYGKRQR